MARTNYRQYLKDDLVILKKYFYVLRPILACKWILSKGTPPPMLFEILVENCLEDNLKNEVYKLLDAKINNPEIEKAPKINILNDYIIKSFDELEQILDNYSNDANNKWDNLNELFISLIMKQ